jgi:hypothetical protein
MTPDAAATSGATDSTNRRVGLVSIAPLRDHAHSLSATMRLTNQRFARPVALTLALTPVIAARPLAAQRLAPEAVTMAIPACEYETCAFTIAPQWNGLAVVAGQTGTRVANLHFFVPRDITPVLAGSRGQAIGADSAAAYARAAIKLRRIGASLTDASGLLAVAGLISALSHHAVRRSDGILLGAGGGALLVSVPFQFAADGALSRAVWWHNVRYAR